MNEIAAKKQVKERNANLDLLRIIAMLTIILLHSVIHSGLLELSGGKPTFANIWLKFIFYFSKIGVNLFILISGYFLVTSKFKLKKLASLWLEVVFYSFTIKLLCMIFGKTNFSAISLLSCFAPIFTGRYWFITIYFGMYVISPFLNILIKSMNKKQHTALNIVLFILFSCLISVHPSFAGMNSGAGWGLPWFTVLYFFAAWFRLYYKPSGHSALKISVWVIVSVLLTIGFFVSSNYLNFAVGVFENFARYDSVPVVIMSLSVFCAFLNMEIKSANFKKICFAVAPLTFGVYLIHDNADLRPLLFEFAKLPHYYGNIKLIPIQFAFVILAFICCAIIDFIRKNTVGKIENSKIVINFCDFLTSKFKKYLIQF